MGGTPGPATTALHRDRGRTCRLERGPMTPTRTDTESHRVTLSESHRVVTPAPLLGGGVTQLTQWGGCCPVRLAQHLLLSWPRRLRERAPADCSSGSAGRKNWQLAVAWLSA